MCLFGCLSCRCGTFSRYYFWLYLFPKLAEHCLSVLEDDSDRWPYYKCPVQFLDMSVSSAVHVGSGPGFKEWCTSTPFLCFLCVSIVISKDCVSVVYCQNNSQVTQGRGETSTALSNNDGILRIGTSVKRNNDNAFWEHQMCWEHIFSIKNKISSSNNPLFPIML